MILFSTTSYEFLKNKLLGSNEFEDGLLERKTFSDGETYLRVVSSVRNKDVVILGGTITDLDLMEIYELGCAISKFDAKSISFVIPFFGYSTMERAVIPGEVVKAKTRARLLSSVPKAHQGNTVYLLDLHAEGILHYFEGDINGHHISAKPLILDHIRSLNIKDYVIASADQGRAKTIQKMADDLAVDSAFITKRRYHDGTVVAQTANADVNGRTVILYDDMIRSGSSILEAVNIYEKSGAKEILLYTTHGVFCGDAKENLFKKDIIKKVIYTDSHPQKTKPSDKEEILSICDLIVKEIKSE